jgi:hypothetical protein
MCFRKNWIAVLAVGFAALTARADDAVKTGPTLLVRVKSIDGLMADVKYFAALAGQDNQAEQLEKALPAFLGPKGIAGTGLDTTKPIGAYGILDPQVPNSQVVVMIPVADEKALVETLTKFGQSIPNAKITKGDDGIYVVNSPAPVEAYFTVADGYAYVTALRKESIMPGARLSAAKLLPADDKTVIGATLRIDRIDDNLKQIALAQFENQIAEAKEKKVPNETPAQAKLKVDLIDHVARQLKSLLTDGKALNVTVSVDRKADDIGAEVTLTAKPETPLAKDLASLSGKPSRFGPLGGAALQAALNVAIPTELRASIAAAMDDGFKQSQEREKDATKKSHAQKVYDVVAPTLKAGSIDVSFGFVGPGLPEKYGMFLGVKVQDAPAMEKLFKELVPQIPDEKARALVKVDADTIAGVKVHKIDIPDDDSKGRYMFGPGASALLAFPKDAAIVVVGGANASESLKKLLSAAAGAVGPFKAEGAVSRLVALDQDNGVATQKVAASVFGSPPKGDVIRFSIDGGDALQVRASMKGMFIKFGVKLDEANKGGKSP